MLNRAHHHIALGLLCCGVAACSGSSETPSSSSSGTTSISSSTGSTSVSSSSLSSATSSSNSSASSASSSSSVSSNASSSSSTSLSLAAQMAVKLGKPRQLLIGLGGYSDHTDILSQNLQIDIFDQYLSQNWPDWNSPSGAYVGVVGNKADGMNAVPMFTFYQMFTLDPSVGDGNLGSINNATFMNAYWARAKLMYQQIGNYNKTALVHLEPDFWGYVERQAPGSNPALMAAYVSANPDCSSQPNNVKGIAGCLLVMARKYAPKAYVGFAPSGWGGDSAAEIVAFMNAVGANAADFIVMETSDRDAGCFEVMPQPSYCTRTGTGWYWDASNATHPNFADHFALAAAYHSGMGGLPLLWWQTPLGVASTTPGGSSAHYRDNRVQYFLSHPNELAAAGGFGVVFGEGEPHQTGITSDGGQFQSYLTSYRSTPTPLN